MSGGVCALDKTSVAKEKTLCVGALKTPLLNGKELYPSGFSNYGVDIWTFGENIFTTNIEVDENGQLIIGYREFNGTSLATPIITGIAGLVWNAYPELTAAQVRESIIKGTSSFAYGDTNFPVANGRSALEYAENLNQERLRVQTLKVVSIGDGEVELEWNPVEGATKYTVYYTDYTTQVTPQKGVKAINLSFPYTIAGLKNGNKYSFIVRAEDDSGVGLASDEVFATPKSNVEVKLGRGLVAYYTFEGGSAQNVLNFIVSSLGLPIDGFAKDGQLSSQYPVTFGRGLIGQAAIFGGVDNPGHIYVPNSSALQFSDGATYSVWFRVDDLIFMDGYHNRRTTRGGGTIFAKSHDRLGAGFMSYLSNTGTVTAYVQTYDTWFSSGTYENPSWLEGKQVGDWVHLVYTLSATEGTKIYLDGQLSYGSTSPVDFTNMNRESLYFGKFSDSWYPFIGAIDEVRIYSRAINEAEIQQLYISVD